MNERKGNGLRAETGLKKFPWMIELVVGGEERRLKGGFLMRRLTGKWG